MTKESFSKAINDIDIEFIDKAINYKKKNTKILKYGSIAAALVIVIAAVIFIGKPFDIKPLPDDGLAKGDEYQNTAHESVKVEGNAYTDEQIRQYIEKNKNTIAFTVAAEYNYTDEIKVMIKGYNHASLGEKNIVKRDFLTLPIIQNDKIIATMVIFTADGEMTNNINIGGEIWDNLNRAFNDNPNDELVFAYSGGICEVVITPDNRIYEINQGGKAFLDEGVDWYSLLKTDYNTFSLGQINNSDNFIVITDVNVPDTVQNPENINDSETYDGIDTLVTTTTTVNPDNNGGTIISNRDITKITVIAQFQEQMGATPITVPDSMLPAFIANISGLKLIETDTPEDFVGGGYVVTVYDKSGQSARYIFMNETLIQINSCYYNETSGSGKAIIDDVVNLLK